MTGEGATAVTAPAQRLEWATRMAMLSGGFMVALGMVGFAAVLPQIEAALASNATDRLLVKMLVSVAGFTMMIGAPVAGFLVDRIGLRRLFIAFGVLFTIGGVPGLFLSSLPLLLAARLLVGLAASGLATMSVILINTRLDGDERNRWMGFYTTATMAGSILLHPLVGFLGEFSWRWPFALYGLGLALALAAALGLSDPPLIVRKEAAADQERIWQWFPIRFFFLSMVTGCISYVPATYIPFLVRSTGVNSPLLVSLIMMVDSIVGASMALSFGWSRQYLSSRLTFLFCFICSALGLSLAALAHDYATIFVGMTICGFAIGWNMPNLLTAVSREVSADRQGRTAGLIKAAHYAGAPISVLVVEPITRSVGPVGAIWFSAGLAFCLVPVFLRRTERGGAAPHLSSNPAS